MDVRDVIGVVLAVACAGCAEDATERATPIAIVGGSADGGDPAVGALVTWQPSCDVPPEVICTAVLIAPRVALTAAHCIDDLRGGQAAIFFGPDLTGPGAYVSVARSMVHPSYDPSTRVFDIGLLVLSSAAVPTPMSLGSATIADVPIGSALRAVGYGVTAANDLTFATAGIRREGTMSLRSVTATDFEAGAAPSMTCRIDSGGPVLAMVSGSEALLGITVGGDAACADRARNFRIDAVRASFIQPTLDAVAAAPPRPGPTSALLAMICTTECARDEDCPLSMTCDATPGGHRCTVPRLMPGAFGAECASDRECGGASCVRLEATGTSCRCMALCMGGPPPPPPPDAASPDAGVHTTPSAGGCGCALAAPRAPASGAMLLMIAGLALSMRSRAPAQRSVRPISVGRSR